MVKERIDKLNQILKNDENIDLKLSYSRLSDFDRNGPKALVKRNEDTNIGMKFGSLTDDLLFNDKEYFDKRYFIYDGKKPSATLGVLIDIILKNYPVQPNRDQVLEIIKHNNFWSNIKDATKLIANFDKDEFWNYLECYYTIKDKNIITSDDYYDSLETVGILKNHDYSKHIFNNDYDNLDQYVFEFKYKGFTFRGIIDRLSIDHKNKIVYQIDLKTGKNNCLDFVKSFIEYRYYFQESIYSLAFDSICEKLNLKGYT